MITLPKVMAGMAAVIACGVVFAHLLVSYGEYSRSHWTPDFKWVVFIVFSILTFLVPVRQFRPSWKRASFWLLTLAMMAAHLVAYVVVLMRLEEWRLVWFALVAFLEVHLIIQVMVSCGYEFDITRDVLNGSGD